MELEEEKIVDSEGNIHKIVEVLGKGGQGIVYRCLDKDVAIKVVLRDGDFIKDKKSLEQYEKSVLNLSFKPIERHFPMSIPLVTLRGKQGYVMKMAEGYKPLKTFLKKPSILENEEKDGIFKINDAIQELCKDNHHMALSLSYYSQTQGLRSQLKILTHLAKLLFRLQSNGLVYGDLNLNNMFYKDNSAFLIDADNVRYESENEKALCVIFTPNYAALEISQTSKNSDTTNYNTMLSDTFSFAIIAYELLNMVHPFDGNRADGDVENFIELPWIEDREDDSNRSRGLLPFFLTGDLKNLLAQCFEEGKKDPLKRPTMPLFIESLEKASLQVLECENCSMTYYDRECEICPYCDAKKPIRLVATSYYQNSEVFYFASNFINPIFLPITLFKGIEVVESEREFAEIADNILIFHHDIQQEKTLINDKRLDHYRIEIDLEKELTISYNDFLIKVQKC
ncbi:protein kinase C-like protein [Helicobacter pylori v225d]|uniref:protein kinase domain-containing protein n=1 Tax=Helicobacter pylori TaxID=210 RepID=UPI0001D8ECDD|nr:protein kinase [Helicobacter pylori]ADI35081.1 protein kinase C-like protein [Helicobacter pylori v225d]